MQHLHPVTRLPLAAQDVAPEVKLTLIRNLLNVGIENGVVEDSLFRDVLTVIIPVFINKNPQNPLPG